MEYISEVLDRSSGDLEQVSLGNWVTITEYGKAKGEGPRTTRAVLARMGLLAEEKSGKDSRWRLTRDAAQAGLGKRHDHPARGKFPFDVLSPSGQAWADKRWDDAVVAHHLDGRSNPLLSAAKDGLEAFKGSRGEITEQMEVCWLLDHFPALTQADLSRITGVPKQSVSRFVTIRADRLRARKAMVSQLRHTLRPGSLGLRDWYYPAPSRVVGRGTSVPPGVPPLQHY